MKNISIIIALAMFIVTGCDKKLDLKNPQAIDAASAFSTSDKVKLVVVANYSSLGATSLFGGAVLWMSELMASDGDSIGRKVS